MAVSASPQWDLVPGDAIRRVDLHARYGGRVQGGMTTSTRSPNVFLFTDPRVGERHGYFDGWEGSHFHYTGMGQRGDQQLRDTNLALLHHEARGLSVRLFRASRRTVTYLGEFDVDRDQPVYQMDAPQTGSAELRQVLVFKLVPHRGVVREPADNRQLPLGLTGDVMEAVLEGGSPIVTLITVEQQHVTRGIAMPPSGPIEVLRREQTLVRDLQDHLEARGSEIKRLEVIPSGEANAIRNDVFDVTRGNIIEAKGSGTRAAVRMALGQLLDYGRFAPEAKRAVLLPTRPRPDLEELLLTNGVHAIWRDAAGFSDNSEGDFT